MSFYFLNESIRGLGTATVPGPELPVKIRTSSWEHLENPPRISKTYNFNESPQLRYFVSEVLDLSSSIGHEIRVIIEGPRVQIETYTHDLLDVTELDLQLARECDHIFRDSQYVERAL